MPAPDGLGIPGMPDMRYIMASCGGGRRVWRAAVRQCEQESGAARSPHLLLPLHLKLRLLQLLHAHLLHAALALLPLCARTQGLSKQRGRGAGSAVARTSVGILDHHGLLAARHDVLHVQRVNCRLRCLSRTELAKAAPVQRACERRRGGRPAH